MSCSVDTGTVDNLHAPWVRIVECIHTHSHTHTLTHSHSYSQTQTHTHTHTHTHTLTHTSTITAITSRLDKLEESLASVSLRSDKLEESVRSWPPLARYGSSSGRGDGTPVIREKSAREKRWSTDSLASLVSQAHDNNHHRPFIWQMPFTVKCIGTFK